MKVIIFIFLLYVVDMLIALKSKVEIDRLKTQLGKEFETKDLGVTKKILGMMIRRERPNHICSRVKRTTLNRLLKGLG